jgi:hypothetical protein
MAPYLEVPVRGLIADPGLSKPTGTDGEDAKYPERASLRGGVGAGMISVATGVLLALASAGHAQSPIGILSPGVLPALQLAVERQLIPGFDTRQAATAHPDTRQSRDWDDQSQRLYDEIMRRAGMPLKDLR